MHKAGKGKNYHLTMMFKKYRILNSYYISIQLFSTVTWNYSFFPKT